MPYTVWWVLAAVLLAIILDLGVVRYMSRRLPKNTPSPQAVVIFGQYSPLLTWLKTGVLPSLRAGHLPASPVHRADWLRAWQEHRAARLALLTTGEFVLILLWTLLITQPLLDFDPAVVPQGREYLSSIQTHHLWTRFQTCGPCAMWNGATRGGSPAFVDPYGSMLHPLVIAPTLVWGVLNGAKIALVLAFLTAGLAQWWLGKVLGLGRLPRLWAALLAVASGHLSARMELGLFGIIFSTAACSLVLPALLLLAQTASRRAMVLLGIALALAALSGQGYMQIGLLFILPAALFLLPSEADQVRLLARRSAQAGLIAFLLAAPFLVPFLHFLPQFGKDLDYAFESGQPFAYLPLNLVIDDPAFFWNETLGKRAYPTLYGNFIGWVAVLLAVFALGRSRTPFERRATRFLLAAAVLALWVGSAEPLRWLVKQIPFPALAEFIAGVRHPSLMAGLAVPALLGLSAIGLDLLLKRSWPRLHLSLAQPPATGRTLSLGLRWLIVFPLLFALYQAREFGKHWILTTDLSPTIPRLNAALRTADLQWVNPPFGDHFYIENAVAQGLKLYTGVQTWVWRDRPFPEPVLEANPAGTPPGMVYYTTVDDINIYKATPGREYALLTHTDSPGQTVCRAYGTGGDLDVRCNAPSAGTLVIKENRWSGWSAWLDGRRLRLQSGQWLSVDLPAGQHTVLFRYRPWDVPLGLLLALIGLGLAVYYWKYDELAAAGESPASPPPASAGEA